MANPGRVLKKRVSGFDFKKPGYPGRVLGFQKCTKLAFCGWKKCQIGSFCQKIASSNGIHIRSVFCKSGELYKNWLLKESEVDFSAFSGADLIILNEVEQINTALQNQILEKSKQGMPICIIPASNLQIQNYNPFLSNLGLPTIQNKQNRELLITEIAFQHPLFEATFEKEISNFQYPEVRSFYNFSSDISAALGYQNNKAFLMNSDHNYLFSAPINQQNSNFQNT